MDISIDKKALRKYELGMRAREFFISLPECDKAEDGPEVEIIRAIRFGQWQRKAQQ